MLGWHDDRPLGSIIPPKQAAKLDFDNVYELLTYYPRAWASHGSGVDIDAANDGDVVTFVGTIARAQSGYTSAGKFMHRVDVHVQSPLGARSINATFFQARLPAKQLTQGARVMMSGKVKFFRGNPQVSHPTYVVITDPDAHTTTPRRRTTGGGGLTQLSDYGSPEQLQELMESLDYLAIYPARKGTTSWAILGAVNAVLQATPPIAEPLGDIPEDLPSFDEALRGIHQPDHRGPRPFVDRIKYNEALALALVMALRRADTAHRTAPPCPPTPEPSWQQLTASLPFEQTSGQRDVIADISRDLSSTRPMSRLLQGEVGSGKTLVALAAMLQVVDAGKQCAFLAPTEVLAVQHARGITNMLGRAGLGTSVVCLTGSMSTAAKRDALLSIISGQADIVVGTHALIQDSVEFFELGLVIVDEQHRFGVQQRDRLRHTGSDVIPHLLVMTATPIPRTIAMTTFGDLDVSTLTQLPGGRKPITSVVVPEEKPAWVARAWERIREEVNAGHQAYVVCPRIEGDGGVEAVALMLGQQIFPDLRVAALHGRMHPEDKDAVMASFGRGDIDVLVSTTVIEVGIDVPNATVMYIREADNFGVSQLHQLRGRVGRGGHASLCLLHTHQPIDSDSYTRLSDIAATSDGFKLAELDLRSRHEGDVLGTVQSGKTKSVKLLSLIDDAALIERANRDAASLVEKNIELARRLVSDIEVDAREFIDKS